ncbi:MAG: bifunctional oligoribonuclease/PAP phosphatase NrnA [Candidatus Adiutrix sp.]|jgi:phosphoesterase RecJ-like protein|nr:bifunctional oligoribonuclease/PAP phosphatase NrnA [Candidatus Adiutrix sp.]
MTEAVAGRPDFLPPGLGEILTAASRVLILTHHNPDGDALGSAAGLALTMLKTGREVDVHLTGSWAEHLNFLLDGLNVKTGLDDPAGYDLVVLLDCHSFDRLGPGGLTLAAGLAKAPRPAPLVVLDHHLLTPDEQTGPNSILDSGASSTGELVWGLIRALGWLPPRPALRAILVAVTTDTGFFSQSNTRAETLRAAADLVELGGSLEEVDRLVNKSLPLRRMKLMGLALETLTLHFGGRLAALTVTPEMLAKTGALMADTEDFVELGRSLAGVTLAALIKDSGWGPGSVRVSLRSREDVDAASLARHFGGGGHRQASAYNDPQAANAREALENLLSLAEKFL